jgi:membrane-associated phospholipid phosphatase
VVVAFIGSRQHVIKILGSLFLCYLAGIVVFVIYPTLGPFVVYPESLTPAYRFTLTGTLMATLAAEYYAAVQGTSVTGFGYFIAMPSLHAAIATLCQCIFTSRRALFWLFVPVNMLLVGSTVVLGYHYIVDVPTGMLLGATVYRVRFRARPARPDANARQAGISPDISAAGA